MAHTKLTDSIEFPESANPSRIIIAIGVVGIIASLVGVVVNFEQFLHSYLTSFTFFISISLGSLFLVMIHHITRSSWGTTLRRIPETFSSYLWVFGLLFIPILIGMTTLFPWTQEQYHPFYEGLREYKSPYLNIPFFVARNIIYFAIWAFLGYKLYQNSIKMDQTGDWGIDTTLRKISAPGIFFFGFTVAFASFDWIMSLRFDWFSTMFGVYYFAMSFQAIFAILLLVIFYLRNNGLLLNTINKAHIRDLGAWLFAFTVFYAYIAFGQFFLIYYANIPEATLFFFYRLEGNWQYIFYAVIFGRFVIPFIVLLSKPAKGNFTVLKTMAVFIVISHVVELYWLIMPSLHDTFAFHWLDLATFLALAGIFLGLFFFYFKQQSMVPKNDPKLIESLNKH
ncbi:quinol:cytochrome c oxidoreductase quinone-binding subunit 2 [Cyclonatronum proteinivorum]|uniref:Quinol:cytochrome c oxidoreductase quinone-binding subunit 2 n=1 Tax=Cyclonatronum proteinivorum TaxID=1457365 RepID=A0A345UP16_9BACT|nr:hypothetical protein [Cyclonatronum proteinivorum]AXJ02218.1 quinol:cytochrome c oxidoreductase quinone-binding subunit 2 [Cyclonatronum proteinivorum]